MRIHTMLVVGVLAIAACSGRSEENDADDVDFDATDWSAELSARAGATVTGTAVARSVGIGGGAGSSTASITLTNGTPTSVHPWHVHSGTCATGGPIVGATGDYPLLEVAADRSARATASIGVGMGDETRYHVNVHRSTGDMTVIACGDLRD